MDELVRLFKDISIRAPVKGATVISSQGSGAVSNFNPRSREGSDPIRGPSRPPGSHFNPRSREGSDYPTLILCAREYQFQSALP